MKDFLKRTAAAVIRMAAPVALMAAAGWLAGDMRGKAADGGLRERLMSDAGALARAADPALAGALSFDPSDAGTEAFEGLKAGLQEACEGSPGGGVYALAARGGRMVTGPAACGAVQAAPGSEYRGDAAAAMLAFESGRPSVSGPDAGSPSPKAAAFVPVAGEDGRSVMVLALEVPAAAWLAEVADARAAPLKAMIWLSLVPALAMLVLLRRGAGAAAPAVLALACGIIIFWAAGRPQGGQAKVTELARRAWDSNSAEAVNFLKFQADEIENRLVLRRAWQARDLQVLAAGAAQLRSSLSAGYGLDCLNYIAPDGKLLVGGDGPYAEGSLVSRATLRRAMARGGDAWGLEAGPLGNYSLRYVRPLCEDGAVSGYLELGMSADLLAAKVGRSLDLDLSAFARKGPGGAVVHSLHQEARLPAALPGAGRTGGAGVPLALDLGGRAYSGGLLRLKASGGQAELAVMDDVTPETAEAFGDTAVKASAAACFIFLALALMWPARARPGGGLHRRILNSLARGFLLVDRDGRIAEANEAYCLMTGYTPGELKGRHMKDLELGKLPAETAAGAERTRHRRKDGSVLEVKSGLQWIGEDGGYIAAFIEKAGAPAPAKPSPRERPVPLYTIIEADGPAVPALERLIGEPVAVPAAGRGGGEPLHGGEGAAPSIRGSF